MIESAQSRVACHMLFLIGIIWSRNSAPCFARAGFSLNKHLTAEDDKVLKRKANRPDWFLETLDRRGVQEGGRPWRMAFGSRLKNASASWVS